MYPPYYVPWKQFHSKYPYQNWNPWYYTMWPNYVGWNQWNYTSPYQTWNPSQQQLPIPFYN
ncbi:hypothetical protein CN488_31115 [Bacillus anthracis]|nr:hypothetical protein CN488_31115 [Bacillus anthracis]PGY63533.1 hypothetical protein COE09_01005 [Bacillus thuringiensis]